MDSIDVHPRFASMQVRNDCNAEVEVVGPVSELQIVARGSLAEQRLHNHGIWCRRNTKEADRAKPLQEPASRDHGLNSPLPRCVVAKESAPTVSDNRIEPSPLIFIWRD